MLINWKKVSAIDNQNGNEISTYPKIVVSVFYNFIVRSCQNWQRSRKTKPKKSIQFTYTSPYVLPPWPRCSLMAMWWHFKIAKQQIWLLIPWSDFPESSNHRNSRNGKSKLIHLLFQSFFKPNKVLHLQVRRVVSS